jgi:molybdate transport system substrate-binding protein
MGTPTRKIMRWVLLLGLALQLGTVAAAEVKVLSTEAFKPAFEDIARGFEQASGHKVTVSYATAGVLAEQIRKGAAADVTILPKPMFDVLAAEGRLDAAAAAPIGQSLFALAVPAGAAKPDISTVDALKRTLLAAKSLTYPDPTRGGGIGVYAAKVVERLGLTEQLRSKTTFTVAGEFRELLATHKAEMAFVLPTVVHGNPAIDVVGTLPAELQSPTEFVFTAVPGPKASDAAAGAALVRYMKSPAAVQILTGKGMAPV